MPSLLTLTTNLKDLRFGNDRPGGGSSNQPYIETPIPDQNQPIPGNDLSATDFLLRGGINAARDTADDLIRLGKYFTDLRSPSGILFTAKQNTLSSIAVRTQASTVGPNEGAYTPLSTLAQAGINFIGGHVDKQGVNPLQGVRTYSDVKDNVIGGPDGGTNRLVVLYDNKIDIKPGIVNPQIREVLSKSSGVSFLNGEILSYSGGPNSSLGFGTTSIQIAKDNKGGFLQTGKNNIKLLNSGFFATSNVQTAIAVSTISQGNPPPNPTLGGFDVFTVEKQRKFSTVNDTPNDITDFREDIYQIRGQNTSYVTGIAPSYKPKEGKTIDGPEGSRINYVSPGQKGNVINYTKGKIVNGKVSVVDQINAQPIYQSSGVREDVAKNDLVKFRIAAINTEKPNLQQFIHFRAFIDSFSDSYSANWNPQKYMGRGESFYKYDSFNRDITLSFTVAAQSKPEIMEMYRKLNFLASNLAPDYTSAGYLAGPLVQLTMGGWCYELPGFIKSLTLDVPQESTWEIGIDTDGKFDRSVKEMPHICRVTGFTFTPIHKFRPAKQELGFDGPSKDENGNDISPKDRIGNVNSYGPERYIALEGGSPLQNNYDDRENYN